MKPVEIYKGLKVVTNDSPHATIYTIDEINGNYVHLVYRLLNGAQADGAWIDVSVLRLPDIYQMANA
jgi:hypothetical protein